MKNRIISLLLATAALSFTSTVSAQALQGLKPDAPDRYTVQRGDTLWGISGRYLERPWNWPQLWNMNRTQVRNPHRIYPGQQLVLERLNGRARLRMAGAAGQGPPTETIRVSPRIRYESLDDATLPTLKTNLIEPFCSPSSIARRSPGEMPPCTSPTPSPVPSSRSRKYVQS